MDFYYEEGLNAGFKPVLQEVVIENVDVTGGAPYSLFMKGYPTPNTSYIEVTLRNITISGLRNSPHYVLENVDSIKFSDVYVQVWQQWNTTSNERSSGHSLVESSFLMLIFSIISWIFVSQ